MAVDNMADELGIQIPHLEVGYAIQDKNNVAILSSLPSLCRLSIAVLFPSLTAESVVFYLGSMMLPRRRSSPQT